MVKAVIEARGDLLTAAKYLRVSLRELDNMLRAIPGIEAVLGSIEEVKADNPAYQKLTAELFERQVLRAMSLYRLAALDSLYSLASMPLSGKAAMMNVKREAAVNLMGRDGPGGQGPLLELTEFFRSLNSDYQTKKQGLTVTRAILIESRTGGPVEPPMEALEAAPRIESPVSAEREPASAPDRKR